MSTQALRQWSVYLALLLTGCGVPQANTIHMPGPGEVLYDPSLTGTWDTTVKNTVTLKLTVEVSKWAQDDSSYRFVVNPEHGKKPVCEGHAYLSRIEGRYCLTVGSADNQEQVQRYSTIVIDEWQPKLKVRILKRERLFQMIKADPTVITHESFPNNDFLVTATTEELSAFYQQHLKEDGLWEEVVLSKKK